MEPENTTAENTTAEAAAPTKPVLPPPELHEGNYVAKVQYVLPASLEKRKSIAVSLGFAEIADVRKDPTKVEQMKAYAKLVKESAEKLDGQITYPAVESLKPEQIQDLISATAKAFGRDAILAARRKAEELPLVQTFNIYDLMGNDEDDDTEYDKDGAIVAVEAFCKELGFNDITTVIVSTAIIGSKAQMLKVRKLFGKLHSAQEKFAAWAAEKQDVDFESISQWLKRQAKRLASAEATPEINESEVMI